MSRSFETGSRADYFCCEDRCSAKAATCFMREERNKAKQGAESSSRMYAWRILTICLSVMTLDDKIRF